MSDYISIPWQTVKKLATCCTVKDQKTSTRTAFILNAAQEDVLKSLCENKKTVILKGRQAGISTICVFYIACLAMAKEGLTIAIVADEQKKSENLLNTCHGFIQELGALQGVDWVEKKNTKMMELKNKSKIIPQTAISQAGEDSRAGRSYSFDFIHFSELAFYPDAKSLYVAMTSSGTSRCTTVVESTSAGRDNFFYEMWESQDSAFNRIFLSIESHVNYRRPEHELDERTWERLKDNYGFSRRDSAAWWYSRLNNECMGDTHKCLKEYPIKAEHAFLAGSRRYIVADPQVLPQNINAKLTHQGKTLLHVPCYMDGMPRSYNPNNVMCPYVVALDPSGGTGNDHHALVVFDRATKKLVFAYNDNTTSLLDIASLAVGVAKLYQVPSILIETNGVGRGVCEVVQSKGVPVEEITTTEASKSLNLALAKRAIERGELYGPERLLEEANSLCTSKRGTFSGKKDMLMACGFALAWMEQNPYSPEPFTKEVSPLEQAIQRACGMGQSVYNYF